LYSFCKASALISAYKLLDRANSLEVEHLTNKYPVGRRTSFWKKPCPSLKKNHMLSLSRRKRPRINIITTAYAEAWGRSKRLDSIMKI